MSIMSSEWAVQGDLSLSPVQLEQNDNKWRQFSEIFFFPFFPTLSGLICRRMKASESLRGYHVYNQDGGDGEVVLNDFGGLEWILS